MSALAQAQHLSNVCSMFVLLALLLQIRLWQVLNDVKPVLEHLLKVVSKLTSEAKTFPPGET